MRKLAEKYYQNEIIVKKLCGIYRRFLQEEHSRIKFSFLNDAKIGTAIKHDGKIPI